jgi:hypothetical protein
MADELEFTADDLTRSYAEAAELDARAAETLERTSPEAAAEDPCTAWQEIRPLVVAASKLWFIPKKIRAALAMVVVIVDSLCG